MALVNHSSKQPDFIGDIHGHFDALEMLFKKMGYEKKNGMYTHSERFPVFIGDYIDRGKKILETLKLVRSMHENGSALAIMGNHEYNYLCYHLKDENDKPFRENSTKNEEQLDETNKALSELTERESYLSWMASLPITLETENYRAVHAQWNDESAEALKKSEIKKFNRDGLINLYNNKALVKEVDVLLKGLEIKLPESLYYKDHQGHERKESRVKWWKATPGNKFSDVFASIPEELMDKDISAFKPDYKGFYKETEKPVFFGHYWLRPNDFGLTASNACCVDFSIAKEGLLAAYRFSGESILNSKNLVKHID
jgi:hypothetical protein